MPLNYILKKMANLRLCVFCSNFFKVNTKLTYIPTNPVKNLLKGQEYRSVTMETAP